MPGGRVVSWRLSRGGSHPYQSCLLEPSFIISEGEITDVAPPPHSTAGDHQDECRGV